MVIGAQKGTHIGAKRAHHGSEVQRKSFVGHCTLLLFRDGPSVTVPPPGETESGSAGTQPDKG